MYILCFGDVLYVCVYVQIYVFGDSCVCICGHICTFNWWCMWCTCVHMVHVCVSIYTCFLWCMWCMYVYMVHPCTNVCLVVHVCVYDTHICTFNWMHVVHMCACGACMCMWCIYAHIYVFGVHECKQVVFHAWKVALFMKSTWKVKSTWKAP